MDIALGEVAVALAFVLCTGRHERLRERRRERKAAKKDQGPPRWQRELSKGSPPQPCDDVVLEVPCVSFLVAPGWTRARSSEPGSGSADTRTCSWCGDLRRSALLVINGVIELL